MIFISNCSEKNGFIKDLPQIYGERYQEDENDKQNFSTSEIPMEFYADRSIRIIDLIVFRQ